MSIKSFLQDEGSVRLGLWAGKFFSLERGREIAKRLGSRLASRSKNEIVRNVKTNQWVVSGGKLDRAGLEQQAREVFIGMTRSLFEYFYYFQHPEQGKKLMRQTDRMRQMVKDVVEDRVPTILLGPHLGNFDLFGLMLSWLGMRPLVLSYPTPNNAYKAQNALREKSGNRVLPITFTAFREAKRELNSGGFVVTGLDRAVEGENQKYQIDFFGRPANLPVFYLRMALETKANVRMGYGLPLPDGSYILDCTDPFELVSQSDPVAEIITNARTVLAPTEAAIRDAAAHWAMMHPVWPDAQQEIIPLL